MLDTMYVRFLEFIRPDTLGLMTVEVLHIGGLSPESRYRV